MQAVCLAACKKLHEMGAFTDMLLPDKGSGEEREKVDQNDEGDPLPGTARHREFYPEGVADILKVCLIIHVTWWCKYFVFVVKKSLNENVCGPIVFIVEDLLLKTPKHIWILFLFLFFYVK